MARWSHSSMKWAPFEGRLAEEDAVVGHDPDRMPVHVGEAGHEGGAVLGLELPEAAAVDDPGDHLPHVVGGPGVGGDHPVQLAGVDDRFVGGDHRPGRIGRRPQGGDDGPHHGQGLAVVGGQVVGDAGSPGVQLAAAELLGARPPHRSPPSPAGGPPRKIVPWLATMMASSLMAGT